MSTACCRSVTWSYTSWTGGQCSVVELSEAFAIGFLIFLPFLVIDLVVGNVLLALGMQMLSPTQVSLPFKLLLFVSVSGWGLLSEALVAGYR